jgi:hypothetical protein
MTVIVSAFPETSKVPVLPPPRFVYEKSDDANVVAPVHEASV